MSEIKYVIEEEKEINEQNSPINFNEGKRILRLDR